MIGKTISHYKILSKLGEGGMGVVYKAEDAKLKRIVALKFLSAIALGGEEKGRFLREAQAAAALNHPNICTIYAIDEVDGQMFIAMEFIEGQSLREKIEAGPMKIEEAIKFAMQIADGLQAAHEKGITHRDIKSANIMITEKNQVKIMDFGLAKLARGGTMLTKEGMTLGTAAYMSPEQARGEVVDHRTDIWSLGVVLYEMISGRLPFRGEYESAMMYSILNEEPEPLTALRTGVPMELERIVNKALAKKADTRYQHIDEMYVDLKNLLKTLESVATKRGQIITAKPLRSRRVLYGSIAGLVVLALVLLYFFLPRKSEDLNRKSVAVLPFTNMNKDEENEYFSDGITEDIITQLSKIGGLRVISRTSSMRYKNTNKGLREISEELSVATILEGSIRRSGNRVRIVSQLIDARTDEHLWAESYDRDLQDIFAVQSEVAQHIARSLQAKLLPSEKKLLAKKPTDNLEAYQLYLQGRFHWNRRTLVDLQKAITFFEQAIRLDSTYALGYASLSQTYIVIGSNSLALPNSVYPKAERYCRKALTLDSELAEAYTALGAIQHEYRWDFAGAEESYKTAIRLNPNDGTTHQWLSELYLRTRRYNLAEEEIRIARSLDPYSLIMKHVHGQIYLAQKRYDETIALLKQVLSENPDLLSPRNYLIYAYMAKKNHTEALAAASKHQSPWERISAQAGIYAALGERAKAKALLTELHELAQTQPVTPTRFAFIYGELGDLDEAFHWFNRVLEARDTLLRSLNFYSPSQVVQADPRYKELLKKIGIEK